MTRVGFPDQTATSASGRWVLEARSPENGTIAMPDGTSAPRSSAFQRNFRYRLLHDGVEVWLRWQQKAETSPRNLFVSDAGFAVIGLHGGWSSATLQLIALDGTLNTLALKHGDPPGDAATISDPSFSTTTAGLYWMQRAMAFFLTDPARWVLTTGRGRRIVVDLVRGEHVLTPDAATLAACEAAENTAGIALLTDAVEHLAADIAARTRPWRWGGLTAAIGGLIRNRCEEALPLVEKLSSVPLQSYSTACRALPDHSRTLYPLAPLANLMLRQHGRQPANHPAHRFDDPVPVPAIVPRRDARVDELVEGITALQAIHLAGAPDRIERRPLTDLGRCEIWHYLVGRGPALHTVSLVFNERGAPSVHRRVSAPLTDTDVLAWLDDR